MQSFKVNSIWDIIWYSISLNETISQVLMLQPPWTTYSDDQHDKLCKRVRLWTTEGERLMSLFWTLQYVYSTHNGYVCIYIIISTIYIYMHDHAWEFIYKYKHIYNCIIMYILYIHAREHGHVKFSVMIPWKSIQRPVKLPMMFCRGSLKCWSPCRVSPWKFWKLNSSGHKLGS